MGPRGYNPPDSPHSDSHVQKATGGGIARFQSNP